MKETYLHYLWKTQSLFLNNQNLVNGDEFKIIKPGKYNTESGPDFFDGIVVINGITWRGNIEIHVNASDWYLHDHQNDRNYDNVILHVVYKNDRPVTVKGNLLNTLELSGHVSIVHKEKFNEINVLKNQINCSSFLKDIDVIYLEWMKERAIFSRLDRKTSFLLDEPYKFQNELEILYTLILKAFGKKVNENPYLQIALNLPYKLCIQNDVLTFKQLIIGMTSLEINDEGFCEDDWQFLKHKYELVPIDKFQWKYKGLRPSSFPEKMLKKLIWFIETFSLVNLAEQINNGSALTYLRKQIPAGTKENLISESLFNHILINAIVPYVWWKSLCSANDVYKSYAVDLLLEIDAETNSILSKWRNIKVEVKKAYDSQALLEIYNEFCSANKCLDCKIGVKILKY